MTRLPPLPQHPAPPPCPAGCTDACPGGAEAHAKEVRHTIDERIQREWPVRQRSSGTLDRPWKAIDGPRGLPRGWEVVSSWVGPSGRRSTDPAPDRLYVVHAPARAATRGGLRRGYRTIPAVPGVWGLVEQRHPTDRPDLRLAEVTLWRLYEMASAPRQPYWPMPLGGWDTALDWLRGLVVERFDLTDENERAEHTLYLLSGTIRTPPAAACR